MVIFAIVDEEVALDEHGNKNDNPVLEWLQKRTLINKSEA